MAEDKGNIVTKKGAWTCVQKVRSGSKSFYVNVICHDEIPGEAVELAGGDCFRPRCNDKSVCFRQIRFKDGHRGYEFSCAKHKEASAAKSRR
jgi:hypothetical protein